MFNQRRAWWTGLLLFIVVAGLPGPARAQQPANSGQDASQPAEDRVVIQREAMRLIDPKRYQVALTLEPVRKVAIAAPVGGRVTTVLSKPGDKLASGTASVRLNDTEQSLLAEQAQAELKAAEIELRRAKKQSDADLVELAEARRDAAKAAHELAKYRLEQTTIRVPFEGEVFRMRVVEGQTVRAGDPLCDFGDPTQLRVEIPIERKGVEAKQTIKLTVEEASIDATVESVLPLDARFEPLRELVQSLASATVLIDNKNGRLRPGQLVDIPLIPQQFVAQIPNRSLSNVADGARKVQVVRSGVIRDVAVRLLGQVGTDLSYVTGLFAPGDELIVSASQQLADGTQVRPAAVAAGPAGATANGAPETGPSRSTTRKAGF